MRDPLAPHINANGTAYNGNHLAVTLAFFVAVAFIIGCVAGLVG